MSADYQEEQKRLRVAALENVEAFLATRQHAERELLGAKEALQLRTDELALQRDRFQITLASIGDAVITTDAHGSITFLNAAAEEMTGWRDAEARGMPLGQAVSIINEDTREPIASPLFKLVETRPHGSPPIRRSLIARDGREVAIEESAAPICNAGDNVGAVIVFRDVSRQRRIERSLRANEERLSAMFAQAAVGIAVTDLSGRFLEANYKFCAILGYSLDELRDRTFFEVTHEEDRPLMESSARLLIEGAIDSYACEKRCTRADGAIVWSGATITLLRSVDGESSQFIGIIEDITARKHAEELRSQLAALVESSNDAIISQSLDGIITTWNPAAQRMFGYAAEEAIGQSITMLIPAELRSEEPSIIARLRAGDRFDHYETTRLHKGGRRIHVSLTASTIKDSSGRIIGASKIARDITLHKEARAELLANDRRKDEFLATLAHELRNPLSPILQAAAISGAASATEVQKTWSNQVITRQVRHMSALLDDLLDLSRITRGTPELRMQMTSLGAIVESAIEIAGPLIEQKHHRLLIEISDEPTAFSADPMRLSQVVSNLLTNAAKYTDPNGTIRLRAFADAQVVTLTVTDTGVGIAKNSLDAVFTMFTQVNSTLDRSEGGLGIGLALARAIVHLHGGTVEARSEGIGHGSEFVMRIPRRALADFEPVQPMPSVQTASAKRRVLIADDNHDAADSLAMLLSMEGHDVTVVHDGRQALASIEKLDPEFALLDIGMPEFDGYEVARRVRQRQPGNPLTLIAVTGWGQQGDRERALDAGFNLHFTKPVEPDRLIDLLRAGAPI